MDDNSMDLDDLLAQENQRRAREDRLFAEADVAFRTDFQLMIDIAQAAASAAEVQARYEEEERVALDPSTAPDEAVRLTKVITAREVRRRAAQAALRRTQTP